MAINELIDGFYRFHKEQFEPAESLFRELATKGQSPKVCMVACSDSRVSPAITLDCDPGQIFEIRNVANLVPPQEVDNAHHGTSAALEFAVNGLQVEHIVVLGHAQCGGIQALLDFDPKAEAKSQYIDNWMRLAESARRRVLATQAQATATDKARACEQAAVLVSLENLMTFPFVSEKVADGRLTLHGWYLDIAEGLLYAYHPDSTRF
ncbi:MAG: carbonic anhydrase, partial [Rhodospirillales bacterium]